MATPIAGIVELTDTQPGKFLDHNKALRHIEALAIGAVENTLDTPPGSPATGQTYIVGTSPTGAWSGQNNKIAQRTDTGWQFYNVFAGLAVANKSIQGFSYFDGANWLEITSSTNLSITDGTTTVTGTDLITISGASITDQGGGDVLIEIPASLTTSDGTTTVNNVDNILFNGATLTDNGSGDIEVTIDIPPTLSVIKGATTVTGVDQITVTGNANLTNSGSGDIILDIPTYNLSVIGGSTVSNVNNLSFSGATVSSPGTGSALVTIAPTPTLTVIQGAATVNNVDQITFTGNAALTNSGSGDVILDIPPMTVTDGTTTLNNITTITAGSGLSVISAGAGNAQIQAATANSLAFVSSATRTLPYTITAADINRELVVSGTGFIYIPLVATGFTVGWQCLVSLDAVGDIRIQKVDGSTTGLIFSSQFNVMRSVGSATIIYRGGTTWKILGFFEV